MAHVIVNAALARSRGARLRSSVGTTPDGNGAERDTARSAVCGVAVEYPGTLRRDRQRGPSASLRRGMHEAALAVH
jgi:hypothetical protein